MTYSNITKKTFGVVLTLLMSLLFSGCIKEDLSECSSGVSITFSYTNRNSEVHFPEGLTQINLYVFDEKGLFYEEYQTRNIVDKRSGTILLNLPAGRYTVVSWGNLSTDHELQPLTKGVSKISDAKLSLVRTDNKVTKRLTSLYHGAAQDIEVKAVGRIHKDIELINNANVLHITLKGLIKEGSNKEDAPQRYSVRIEDNNGDYKFDNTLATQTPLTYIPTNLIVGNDIIVETVTLRLFEQGSTTLVVEDNKTKGTTRLDYNLIEQILKTSIKDQAGLDRCDYYDIEIEIATDGDTHTTSSIRINGWVVYQSEVELG